MTRARLDPIQRKAIWLAYNKKCFYCGKFLEKISELNIDHILPLELSNNQVELRRIISDYGLDPEFKIESYTNYVPSCFDCNAKKGSKKFPKRRILYFFSLTESKIELILKNENQIRKNLKKSKIISSMEILIDHNFMTKKQIVDLYQMLVEFIESIKNPLIVCFGLIVDEDLRSKLPKNKQSLDYPFLCDYLSERLVNAINSNIDCLFSLCGEDKRDGECLSIRTVFWGVNLKRFILNFIKSNGTMKFDDIWEILEIEDFNEIYNESAAEFFQELVKKIN